MAKPRSWVTAVEAAALFGLALAVRVVGMPLEPNLDELNHVLAAQRLLSDGTLMIGEGASYTRGWVFTYLVAGFIRSFGDSLFVARLPSVLAGSLAPVVLYALGRQVGARWCGLIAGLLLSLDPAVITSGQSARFYPFQLLAFLLLTSAVVWWLVGAERGPGWKRWVVAALGVVLLALVLHFQIASVIGVAGMGLSVIVLRWRAIVGAMRRQPLLLGAGLALAAVGALVAVRAGTLASALALARLDPPWGSDGGVEYYFGSFLDRYPLLWSLFPALFLLALTRRVTIAVVAGGTCVVVLLTHSLLPWKEVRFINYVTPHFLLVSVVGGALILQWIQDSARRFLTGWTSSELRQRRVATGIVIALVAFAAVANRSFLQTGRLVTLDQEERRYRFPGMGPLAPPVSWSRAVAALRGTVDSVAVVVSTTDLKSLYFLGRLDYALNPGRRGIFDAAVSEFMFDPRIGVPVVATWQSIDALIRCHSSGLIVAESLAWRTPRRVRPEIVDRAASDSRLVRISLPEKTGIIAYRWGDGRRNAPPADCPERLSDEVTRVRS